MCSWTNNSGMSNLNEDLLAEIFVRLPLKPLFRSNCVSKEWHSLISGECLRRRLPPVISGVYYRSLSGNKDSLRFAWMSEAGFEDSNLEFFPFRGSSVVVDCCNGLLLLCSSSPAKLCVCNPITRQWIELPPPRKRSLLSILAYDPVHSPHFNVVCFTAWRTQGADVEVFSSGTGHWVEEEVDWGLDTNDMSATIRYLRGVLYILAHQKCLVAIDMNTMQSQHIELPELAKQDWCIGMSNNKLHFASNDGEGAKIWVLDDAEQKQWALKQDISVGSIVERKTNEKNSGFDMILGFDREMEKIYLRVPRRIVCYSLKEKRFGEVCELGGVEMEKAHLMQMWVFPFTGKLQV